MNARIRKLFSQYVKAFATFDTEGNLQFFADDFMGADPNGARVFKNDAEFYKGAKEATEGYRRLGMNSAKILSISEIKISTDYSLVNVHYGVKFKKTGDKVIEFDVSYLVSKVGEEPKIILFISHEDEQQTMRDLGLI